MDRSVDPCSSASTTAVDAIFLSQTLTHAVHVCSISWFYTGQHSADLITLRVKTCMHTWQPQAFTVALALIYLVELRAELCCMHCRAENVVGQHD